MKKLLITFFCFTGLVISPNLFAQNVSVNADGSLPDTSAMLDVSSTSKGFLLPRMTTTQQNAIVLPANGLTIFNTTLNTIMINTGTSGSPVWSGLTAGSIDTSSIANFSTKVRSLFSSTAPITFTNGLVGITQAGTSSNGYLSSTDWNTFNSKGSGVTSLASIGSSPNATGGSISGSTLTLQPADATHGGVVTTGTQTLAGDKTFTGNVTLSGSLMLPMGEISYFNITGTLVTISAQSDGSTNMVKVAPATTFTNDVDFDNGGSNNGRLRYIGATTRTFHIAFTFSATSSTPSDVFVSGVAKNGVVQANSKVLGSSQGTQFSALHVMLTLNPNDYLELYMGNTSGSRNTTVKSLNIFALGM